MANTDLYSRLKKLFSTGTVVRTVGKRKLRIIDTDQIQSVASNAMRDRYSKIHAAGGYAAPFSTVYGQNMAYQTQRIMLFRDYDQMDCIIGDTKIPLLNGTTPTIKELSQRNLTEPLHVFSYDSETNTMKIGSAHHIISKGIRSTIKITLDKGEEIICTEDHLIMLRDGQYKRAIDLQPNDRVMPFYRKDFYKNGYRCVYNFSKGWQSEHVVVAEQFQRELLDTEIVHHKNFDKTNNEPENLEIMDAKEHKAFHMRINNEKIWAPENYGKQCAAIKAAMVNRDYRATANRRSGKDHPNYGTTHTEEWKQAASIRQKEWLTENAELFIGEKNPNYRDDITLDFISNAAIQQYKETGSIKIKDIKKIINCSEDVIRNRVTNWTDFKNKIIKQLNHKVISVEKYQDVEVFDMTVDKYHNFATEHCFVHNCDPILCTALDVYAEETTLKSEYGEILTITTEDGNIKDILHNLFYDILNIEHSLFMWIRNMPVKYDTFIPLLNGNNITIKELSDNLKSGEDIWVYSVQDNTNKIVPGKVIWCDKTYITNKIVKIIFDDNSYVETSPEHPFIRRDGTEIRADNLKIGDSLMPFYRKLKTEQSIKDYESVYEPDSNDYRFTHRVITEALGLRDRENKQHLVVHHKDFNKYNNSPTNFQMMSWYEHLQLHRDIAKEVLHSPEVTAKRMAGIDKWLRSDKHKQMLKEQMIGIYPEPFKKYNSSSLHEEHNSIRKEKMIDFWKSGGFDYLKINWPDELIGILKHEIDSIPMADRTINWKARLGDKLLQNEFFCNTWKQYNKRQLRIHTFYEKITEIVKETKLSNHKIKSIEFIDENVDVYCMSVTGPNGEDDRHNFAICGKDELGNITKDSGVFVKNCKYGDAFLFLEIAPEYGIHNVLPLSVYDTTRIEGENPDNPYYVYFETLGANGYKQKFENYEIAHFRMNSDASFLPYGRSVIEHARRIYRQLVLQEDAMMIHRIMRAPDRRIFKIDIGNIPPAEVDAYMERLMDRSKRVPFYDDQSGEYNMRYNMMNVLQDFYIPVRGNDSGTSIENLGGLEYNGIEDVEYLLNKMLAALKIPKSYFGYEDSSLEKSTLAMHDLRFARTIERIQRTVVSELTKIAIIHLYSQGYTDEELVNFSLSLTNPSTVSEQEKVNLWTQKLALVSSMQQASMMSNKWMYKELFDLPEEEIMHMEEEIVEDKKRAFRLEQLQKGQSDPAKFGYPQNNPPVVGEDGETPNAAEGDSSMPKSLDDLPTEEEVMGEEVENRGRPKKGMVYGQDTHPRGRDPVGTKSLHGPQYERTPSRKSAMSLEHKKIIEKFPKNKIKLKPKMLKEETSYMDESNIIEENDEN